MCAVLLREIKSSTLFDAEKRVLLPTGAALVSCSCPAVVIVARQFFCRFLESLIIAPVGNYEEMHM